MSKSLSLPGSQIGPRGTQGRVDRAIAVRRSGTGIPWDQIKEAVQALANGRLLPQGMSVEQAIVACAKGAELGIPPMQAIQTIPVINGRPSMEAKLMLALAYRHLPAFDYQVVKWSREGCQIKGRRSPQHSWVEVTYDKQDASAAGLLNRGPWKAHPKAMFFARACAMLCRAIAPDVFAGLYDPDEAASLAPGESLDDMEPLEAVVVPHDDDETVVDNEPPAEVVDDVVDADAAPDRDTMLAELRRAWKDERKPALVAALARMEISPKELDTASDDILGDLIDAIQ